MNDLQSTISSRAFSPSSTLPVETLEELSVESLGRSLAPELTKHGWKELACASVGISLRANNAHVAGGGVYLFGKFPDASFKPSRFWPDVDESFKVTITIPDLSIFTLKGELYSKIVDSSEVSVQLRQPGKPAVPEVDFPSTGLGGFSLRILSYPSADNYLKTHLLLFPFAKDLLLSKFPCAEQPSFPGAVIASQELPFLPATDVPWGLRFLPFIMKDAPDSPLHSLSGDEVRKKIGSLLQKGHAPKAMKATTLVVRWETLSVEGEEALSPLPVVPRLWPNYIPFSPADFREGADSPLDGPSSGSGSFSVLSSDGEDNEGVAEKVRKEVDALRGFTKNPSGPETRPRNNRQAEESAAEPAPKRKKKSSVWLQYLEQTFNVTSVDK